MKPRRTLTVFWFAALVAVSIRFDYLSAPFRARIEACEDRPRVFEREWWPYYSRFLDGVHARTRPGDTIALRALQNRWFEGYEFAFFRATYLLAGRTVLPLIDRDDLPHPENLGRVRYLAVFGLPPEQEGFVIVWRSPHGALLRRLP